MQIKKLFYILVAISLPMGLAQIWFKNNHAYPIYDAANYFIASQKIFQTFRANGLLSTIHDLYTVRSWKPVSLSVFGAPFLIFTDGKVLPAIQMTMTCFLSLFLVYTFLIFRTGHSSFVSIAATWFIGTIPWLLQSTFVFQSELPFLAFFVAALYHFLRSNTFRIKRHSAICGAWLALAITLRPVEAVITTCIPLIAICALGFKEKVISRSEIISFCLSALLSVSMFFCIVFDGSLNRLFVLAAGIAAGIAVFIINYFLFRSHRLKSGFTRFYLIILTVDLLWYLPFSKELYYWLYTATFGQYVQVFGRRDGISFLTKNGFLFFGGWGLIFWILTLPFIIKYMMRLDRKKWMIGTALVAGISLPLVIGSVSLNTEPRYIFTSVLAFYFGIVSIVLSAPPKPFAGLLFAPLFLVNCLFTYQLATADNWVSMERIRQWVKWDEIIPAWRMTPLRKVDPAKTLVDELRTKISVEHHSRIGLIRMVGKDLSQIMDMEIFQVIVNESQLPWHVSSDIDFEPRTPEQWKDRLQEKFDFLIVGDIDDQPDRYTVAKYGKYLSEEFKSDKLSQAGWQILDKINLVDEVGQSVTFLLLKPEFRRASGH